MTIDLLKDSITNLPFYPLTHELAVIGTDNIDLETKLLDLDKKPLIIEVPGGVSSAHLSSGTYNSITTAISENRTVIVILDYLDGIDYYHLIADAQRDGSYLFGNGLNGGSIGNDDVWAIGYSSSNTHSHGNINQYGRLSTTTTISNADKLVITDANASNSIKASSISFNGSTTNKALTQKGTWENVVNSVNGQSGAVTLGTAASLNAGSANGVATLDSGGKVPASQLPSYVDDIVEGYYKEADGKFYSTLSGTTYSNEITGESGKIYVDLTTSKSYRWSGSSYIIINANSEPEIIIHEISSTTYPNASWGDEYNASGLNILDSTLYNTISQEIANGKEVLIKTPFYMGIMDTYLKPFVIYSGEFLAFSNSSYIDNYLYSFELEIHRDGNINYYIKNPEFLTEDLINLDGVKGAIVSRFCSCVTAAATAAKTASIAQGEFTLLQGTTIYVNFINANTADNPTLNISNSGAKNIFINGTLITTGDNKKALSGIVTFIYDGTLWNIISNYFDDISGKADKVTNAVNGNFAGLDSNGNLIDSGKKASDFGTYSKPSGGIPKTDLASAVLTSLGLADTAVQPSFLNSSLYAGSINTSTTRSYITEPEVKSIKINGSTTNAASTDNCYLLYDTTNKCLKFIFN